MVSAAPQRELPERPGTHAGAATVPSLDRPSALQSDAIHYLPSLEPALFAGAPKQKAQPKRHPCGSMGIRWFCRTPPCSWRLSSRSDLDRSGSAGLGRSRPAHRPSLLRSPPFRLSSTATASQLPVQWWTSATNSVASAGAACSPRGQPSCRYRPGRPVWPWQVTVRYTQGAATAVGGVGLRRDAIGKLLCREPRNRHPTLKCVEPNAWMGIALALRDATRAGRRGASGCSRVWVAPWMAFTRSSWYAATQVVPALLLTAGDVAEPSGRMIRHVRRYHASNG
jgi:hypothetical protein